jgi:6-pyruvoyltetrahydropterin/6-carboxytetrahydropterin synthase
MLTITKEFSLHAAHRLHLPGRSAEENLRIYGNCARLHGHTYTLQVTLAGQPDETGMLLHFDHLKQVVRREILDRYDHADLSELAEYRDRPATAENMAEHIFTTLDRALTSDRYHLHQITVYETPTAWATRTRHA